MIKITCDKNNIDRDLPINYTTRKMIDLCLKIQHGIEKQVNVIDFDRKSVLTMKGEKNE